jgi:hypothetical protein
MNHAEIVKTYSDQTLAGIIRDLAKSRKWTDRLDAAFDEMDRRNRIRRQKSKP